MEIGHTIKVKYSETQTRTISCVQDPEIFKRTLARTHPKAEILSVSEPKQYESCPPPGTRL